MATHSGVSVSRAAWHTRASSWSQVRRLGAPVSESARASAASWTVCSETVASSPAIRASTSRVRAIEATPVTAQDCGPPVNPSTSRVTAGSTSPPARMTSRTPAGIRGSCSGSGSDASRMDGTHAATATRT